MKVHSQTLMAMKSGCKIYTQKCYVTLEWPLMLHLKHRLCCVAHNLCNVPSENNSACELKCPYNVISRTNVPFLKIFFLKQCRALFQSWAEH